MSKTGAKSKVTSMIVARTAISTNTIQTRAQSLLGSQGRGATANSRNSNQKELRNGQAKVQSSVQSSTNANSRKGSVSEGLELVAVSPAVSQCEPHGSVDERRTISTVYLEPILFDKEIPIHPVEVGKWLHQAGFKRFKEITKIGKFRYKLDLEAAQDYDELRKVDLAEKNLKLYTPKLQNQTICFVPGVPESFEEADLETDIVAEVPVIKVERMKRRDRNQQLVNTNNLKVTVQGQEVPRMIKIYGVAFRAHLYIFPVKQCVQCWKFGHTRARCHGRAHCRKCGQSHVSDGEECQRNPLCINCGKEHESNSRECSERMRRINILGKMREKRVPFAEAEKEFPRTQNRFSLLAEEQCFTELPETEAEIGARTGAIPKWNRTWGQRQGNNKTGQGLGQEQGQERNNGRPRIYNETIDSSFARNPHKATEFEAFITELRKEFIRFCNAKEWLKPLAELRDKLRNRIQMQRTEIETDELLIEVSTDIESILNNELGIENEIQNKSATHDHGL